jgi:hypothetical protein
MKQKKNWTQQWLECTTTGTTENVQVHKHYSLHYTSRSGSLFIYYYFSHIRQHK